MTPSIISPKSDFNDDPKRADRHQEIVLSPEFKHAMQVALLSYTMRLTDPRSEPIVLGQAGLKIEGAKGVLEELINLGKISKLPSEPSSDELDPL